MFPVSFNPQDLFNSITQNHPSLLFLTVLSLAVIFLLKLVISTKRSPNIFLLDFACYKPHNDTAHVLTHGLVVERTRLYGSSSEETLGFIHKMLERSGLGNKTYLPVALTREPPNPCIDEARKEAMDVVFGVVDDVLEKTGLQCKDIGILIVNCSIFNVVPSLSSMIVNKYKLKDTIITYNIGGMGCSGGLRAIGLAQQLLRVHRDTCALVVSTENITENWYPGDNRSMHLINCLFRVGGAAMLLTNRPADRKSSKYQLMHTVHTHTGESDQAYNCIHQVEDKEGRVGVIVTKDLTIVVIRAIKINVTQLGRLVLPLWEQVLFQVNHLIRRFNLANIVPYVPSFKKSFEHFFPHVGAKAILDELEKSLGFSKAQMEAARMTLYRFGNTSSSSIWYELAYAEAKGRIKKGDRMWQIAMGSGFKCSSVVWKAMRNVGCMERTPWTDEIDQFPVDVGTIEPVPYYFEPSN